MHTCCVENRLKKCKKVQKAFFQKKKLFGICRQKGKKKNCAPLLVFSFFLVLEIMQKAPNFSIASVFNKTKTLLMSPHEAGTTMQLLYSKPIFTLLLFPQVETFKEIIHVFNYRLAH